MSLRAAGFLIFRQISNQIEYLLLQTSYGGHHWTPPKGHVDAGETCEETALRETREEAGLSAEHLSIDYGFKRTLNYNVGNKSKVVVYWLAELKDPKTPILLSDEHQDFKWLLVDQACHYAEYPDQQQVIKEADEYLKARLNIV
uniref:Bis(5'-nucleosyl)-tetraphosphatase [asymmetrical] n=1 Tax=Strigamia maritima TaxID=126957 RepID=T1JHB0_STRMM